MNDAELIDGLIKWAAAEAPTLVGNLKTLASSDPTTQKSVVDDLLKINAPITAPSLRQVLTDKINPFGTPLVNRPNDWADKNVLPAFKAGLRAGGTNYSTSIGDIANQLQNPSGQVQKWYKDVISSPVNAGFSNQVMNVLTNRLPQMNKKSADQNPLKGGIGDKMDLSKQNPQQVNKGIAVEKEHTPKTELAKDIVKDHLTEDPDYYSKLEKIEKSGAAAGIQIPNLPPATGPEAIEHALSMLDLDHLHESNMAIVKSGKKTRRPDAIRILGLVEGFRRSGIHPKDLMLSKIPVIPPKFRPFNVAGDTFIPGDANELYRDLVDIKDAHGHLEAELGVNGAMHNRINVYDAVKSVYGFGDPVKAKTLERGVSGFLRKVTGTSPKFGAVQRTLISKPVDYVGRGVIGLDPSLQLDEIGLPEDMAWKLYAPHVQRRLVRSGHSPSDSVKAINDRSVLARKQLDNEIAERPTMYSRAPAWHKFNVIGGTAKIIPGTTIMINPLVGTGLSADHDGDQMNVHVPALPDAVKDVKERLMPSRMLFSIKDREKVVPVPKHEFILGLYQAKNRVAKQSHSFPTEQHALAAINSGKVNLSDDVTIG